MSDSAPTKREAATLLVLVFVAAACGIFYELLISTVSSYFLGNSVLQFSLTIGIFLFFMGVGSLLSKYITENLLETLFTAEIAIGIVGGMSALLLYITYSLTEYYWIVSFLLIASISTLIGLEIPILTRILQRNSPLKDAIAHVLSVDYLGALIASIVFPLVLLPYLGLLKTAFFIGLFNLTVALFGLQVFRKKLRHPYHFLSVILTCGVILIAGASYSFAAASLLEQFLYQDEIIYSQQTQYQKLILTQFRDDLRLFLNGQLQFSSVDEYRYHESLVHIPFGIVPYPENVLVLGGGDGLAVREILKYPSVRSITVVDIDPTMTNLAKTHNAIRTVNKNALSNEKVKVINADAFSFLQQDAQLYSVIIADLPDPDDASLAKLYSKEFYQLVQRHLTPDGVFVTQSTSPYFAQEPFWMIHHTVDAVFEHTMPYWTYVPSFGQWGFQVASGLPIEPNQIRVNVETQFLSNELIPSLFVFEKDIDEIPTDINTLDNPILFEAHNRSWEHWN